MRVKPIFWIILACLLFWYLIIHAIMGHSQELTDCPYYNLPNKYIVNAIYLAEGGKKAKVPYGILSVKVKDEVEARQVCLNTVRNNKHRFLKQSKYTDFIEFLGSRYCPVSAHKLNKNWVKNVKYFIKKQGVL